MSVTLLQLWGKAGRPDPAAPGRCHPAICHMIDVGMVARTFLRRCAGRALRERLLGPLAPAGEGFLAFLVALHDLGKLVPPFQAKRPDLYPPGAAPPAPSACADHGEAGAYWIRCALMGAPFWWSRRAATDVAIALGGHHGVLRQPDTKWQGTRQSGDATWQAARVEAITVLQRTFVADEPSPELPTAPDAGWLVALAGFTSVMDWIGSFEGIFAYVDGPVDLASYPSLAEVRAERALAQLGWLGWTAEGQPWGERLFPDAFQRPAGPRPMQTAVLDAAAGAAPGPKLAIIEAPMGEGKTEAALALAERWIHQEQLQGLYYALPTQATSNQMFGRVVAYLAKRYPGYAPEMHLLHANRLFHPEYQALRPTPELPASRPQHGAPPTVELACAASVHDADERDDAGGVRATEWFRGRKRGLLAHFAVGTIDQALMGVLGLRHNTVRLFGLAGKVLIVDEVHAYDAYMTRELERLLEWARAMGTSVVMLSATLPASKRAAFVAAYSGQARPESDYPAMTVVDRSEVHHAALPPPPACTVLLERVPREVVIEAPERALDPAAADGHIAWICNTVGSAQDTYLRLAERLGPDWELQLFHARMPLRQRLAVEDRALTTFGASRAGPGKRLIVATQVVEQSLDLDFDLLVSELCPIDLLLQRSGRLHRHVRDDRPSLRRRTLRWIEPAGDGSGLPAWGADRCVYDPYVLLATWALLAEREEVVLPDDMRSLVEFVYGEPPRLTGRLGEELERLRFMWEERTAKDESTAGFRLLPRPDDDFDLCGLDPSRDDEDDDGIPVTRLGNRGHRVALLFEQAKGRTSFDPAGARLLDLARAPDAATVQEVVLSSVTLSRRGIAFDEVDVPAAWRRTPLLRRCKPLLLDRERRWTDSAGQRLRWDEVLGVVYE